MGSTLADGGGTPGLAKWGRRADTSGVRLGDGFGELVGETREDPEMRRECDGRFPGSSAETGTGIIKKGGIEGREIRG